MNTDLDLEGAGTDYVSCSAAAKLVGVHRETIRQRGGILGGTEASNGAVKAVKE